MIGFIFICQTSTVIQELLEEVFKFIAQNCLHDDVLHIYLASKVLYTVTKPRRGMFS